MARVMLHKKNMPKSFWGEAVNTACHTLNRVYFKPDSKQTPYELWRGKKPVFKYFRIFGSDYCILHDRENLEKFDVKSDKEYFLGYSSTSRAYRVYNLRTKIVMESSNVVINDELSSESHSENNSPFQENIMEVDDSCPANYVRKHSEEELLLNDTVLVSSSSKPSTLVHETQQEQSELSPPLELKGTSTSLVKGLSSRVKLNHPTTNILGSLNDNMRLRLKALNLITHSCCLSQFEPKKVDEALQDADWVNFMHEKLHQFVRNDVWELVPRPTGVNVIGTKWIFKKKSDEHGTIIRNKINTCCSRVHTSGRNSF